MSTFHAWPIRVQAGEIPLSKVNLERSGRIRLASLSSHKKDRATQTRSSRQLNGGVIGFVLAAFTVLTLALSQALVPQISEKQQPISGANSKHNQALALKTSDVDSECKPISVGSVIADTTKILKQTKQDYGGFIAARLQSNCDPITQLVLLKRTSAGLLVTKLIPSSQSD